MENMPDKLSHDSDDYRQWQTRRASYFGSEKMLDAHQASRDTTYLQLIVRAQGNQLDLLADTLDSLIGQSTDQWHLHVISEASPPEGLDSIPCLSWHVSASAALPETLYSPETPDSAAGWIMEIPVGARLDPAFIFRLAREVEAQPDALCFFVDDDVTDADGSHTAPRFKFGVNQTALLSSDLAGPVCVRGDAWADIGGAGQPDENPWFSQLLRLSEKHGWHSIRHIPDVLISYPQAFPINLTSSIAALVSHFKRRQISAGIVPFSSHSWHVRYQLPRPLGVSIAILSTGQLDLLSRCFKSLVENTDYPDVEIIIALSNNFCAPDIEHWLSSVAAQEQPKVRVIQTCDHGNHAGRSNAAVAASTNDFVLLVTENALFIQKNWLGELVGSCTQAGIGGVSPRLIQPGSAIIRHVGNVLGLGGMAGSPYQDKIKLGEELGYLDCVHGARDVSTLPADCMLVRRESYIRAGGMDEENLGDTLAETDLCLKIRQNGERLIFQPLANVVCGNATETTFESDDNHIASQMQARALARKNFYQRWYPQAARDPFWNANLSLADNMPSPEVELLARWQFIPSDLPRILAHSLANASGDFRINSPLKALSQAGQVSECICPQRLTGRQRKFSPAEIIRLNPDSIIAQNYIHNTPLSMLTDWAISGHQPFTIYALDDLITGLDSSNPNNRNIPENTCARLHYVLQRCDRLVVTTDYLANAYEGYIPDIRIVPNRLEQDAWLPLRSLRRTGKKPRIGWAGGNTHREDLLLLREIIEQTRGEADWIFFGMCPDEIRPLLAEYHPPVEFRDYPAYLASLNLDLAVAPLSDTPFNRGKSNLRLLEYGILGIPVVCSDLEPYRNNPACRVVNSPTAWTEAIRARLHDPDAREREGDALQRWVREDYLLENHLQEWLAAHLPD
jgi:GT2 family glycosyltransferase/glycosyltransferase involved in cell wall biosynthesis